MKRPKGFTPETNRAFLNAREFLPLPYLRGIYVVFVLAYSFFALTDIYYFPDIWRWTFFLRFGVVIPVLIAIIAASFHDTFLKIYQWLLSFSFIVGGFGIAVMLILLPENVVYYGGLFLVYFSGYFMIKLRYVPACVSGWTVFLFHVIGKISIPDHILGKPERLTEEEYDLVKAHTETGYQILRAADEYSDLAIHALHHHENWNGKGYPKGLKEHEIPLFSRIISVADAYEAMTSDRPYRKAMSPKSAAAELLKFSGIQFDPQIVDVFLNRVLNHPET